MLHVIDTSGLSCPQPVLEVKKFMDSTDKTTVEVITDNDCSRENIRRFARQQGWAVRKEEVKGEGHLLLLEKL